VSGIGNSNHRQSPKKRPHVFVLVWLLLAAQLFSQLHAIGHLDDAAHDGHSEGVCLVCVLSSGLDSDSVVQLAWSDRRFESPQLAHVRCRNVTPKRLTTYQGRAPPLPSSIA
jgi:hypothetical protein